MRIVGNLGSNGATTVFATSDGDTDVDTTDQWIGTDDGAGGPAIIDYIHGPLGLQPTLVVRTGDNIEWTYSLTVPAGRTVRLATLTSPPRPGPGRGGGQRAGPVASSAGRRPSS